MKPPKTDWKKLEGGQEKIEGGQGKIEGGREITKLKKKGVKGGQNRKIFFGTIHYTYKATK